MGVSVSAASAIIFISVIISLSILWDAYDNKDEMVDEARKMQVQRSRDVLDTRVNFVNITYDSASDELWINALNNGSGAFDLDHVDIYVDGNVSFDLGNSLDIWFPLDTINFTAGDIMYAPDRVKLACPNGVSIYGTGIIVR